MKEIQLIRISKSDKALRFWMMHHYSQPWGFVGRQLIYKIGYDGIAWGAISGGSATRHLPGRKIFMNSEHCDLNQIISNTFYHVERAADGKYPLRNFVIRVLELWRYRVVHDWLNEYDDSAVAFESLIELPRTGETYKRDGWSEIGLTKGMTCKREASSIFGARTDSYSGKRVWTQGTQKRVFMRWVE